MADYIYEHSDGRWVTCGDLDHARRELLEQHGFALVEVVGDVLVSDGEPMPDEAAPADGGDDEQ